MFARRAWQTQHECLIGCCGHTHPKPKDESPGDGPAIQRHRMQREPSHYRESRCRCRCRCLIFQQFDKTPIQSSTYASPPGLVQAYPHVCPVLRGISPHRCKRALKGTLVDFAPRRARRPARFRPAPPRSIDLLGHAPSHLAQLHRGHIGAVHVEATDKPSISANKGCSHPLRKARMACDGPRATHPA